MDFRSVCVSNVDVGGLPMLLRTIAQILLLKFLVVLFDFNTSKMPFENSALVNSCSVAALTEFSTLDWRFSDRNLFNATCRAKLTRPVTA